MDKPSNYPKNAKRVFKGGNFDVWQWPQKMFDGSTETFERVVQMGGISVLATVKDKIVIIKQQQPGTKWYYSFPGGALDHPDEDPKKAALRELLEETGLQPKTIKLWKIIKYQGRLDHSQYIYLALDCEQVQKQALDAGEKIKVSSLGFEELLKFTDHPQFHNNALYFMLLEARVNKKQQTALKQALFGKKKPKSR